MKIKTVLTIILILALAAVSTPVCAEVTDRVWPASYGGAHVCLWKNDALGAISYTIDDNPALDHDWWIEMSTEYGFKATWFVITDHIVEGPIGANGWGGTWNDWKRLYSLGHDVQSHTVTHHIYEDNIEYEYSYSKQILEEKIPGNEVLTIAYPAPGTYYTDPEFAKNYYIGGRGVGGLINEADEIDYMNTYSFSSFNYDPGFWASITNILKRNPDHANRVRDYRGWQCMHFHGIEDKKDNLIEGFEFVRSLGDDMWTGKFKDVILYVRERDTAHVNVNRATSDRIELSLTDQMNNDPFDHPLTIKVRLDNSWGNIHAVQAGRAISARLMTHNGGRYALVDVVPDNGVAVLTKQAGSYTNILGDVTGDGDVSTYDASLVAQYAVGIVTFTAEQRQAADVTGNSDISAYDASLIAQYAIRIIDGF